MIAEKTVAGIRDGKMTLRGAMARFRDSGWAQGCKDGKEGDLEQALVNKDSLKEVKRMCMILMPFFQIYDENGDNQIDFEEFRLIFRDVNENLSKDFQQQLFAAADADESGYISFEEFVACVMSFALDASNDIKETGGGRKVKEVAAPPKFQEDESKQGDDDEEGEEAEDIPEDLADLSVEEQQSRIKKRSLYMMSLGTVLVIAFSDPMVDLLGEIGERVGIPAFYISFLLAPLASNSSELVAAYNYAQKRTAKSIVTSLAQLEGAAIMNNTFCLGIFLALVYFKGLAWEFSAETISIASIQLMLGVMVLLKKKQRLVDAFIVLSFYPVSLGIVWLLENKFGWD
jgi:Ca2+/Na+ antiporter